MSDATKLIIGIALAVAVLALIVWLFASARRREVDARRMEADAVRARLAERVPVVQEREDRASVTAQIAEEARREAEAAAAEAARLEQEAADHRTEADRLRDEQASLAREADRLDPDVRTDDEGYRVDDSGRRLSGSTVASAFGAGAAALEQDDEPDLADHENPFPGYAAEPAEREGAAASAHSTTPESSVQDPWAATPESSVQDPWAATPESSVQNVRAPEAGHGDDVSPDPDWVNGPVDEDAADEVEAQAARDAKEADWINGPEIEAAENVSTDAEVAAASAHSTIPESSGQDVRAATSESSVQNVTGEERQDEGAPFPVADEGPVGRRVSSLEEVVDGGYGVGSAAPIADGAQPLEHPVMGFRDSMTFTREGEGAPASDPDVWFYDEDAARRSGFRPAGEE